MERSNHGSNPQGKKDRSKADSYIPISLTSCVGKLVERLINTRLTWYLEKRQIITPQKAGFRQNISTESQMAYIAQEIEDALQDKKTYTRGLDLPIKNIRQSVEDGLKLKMHQCLISGLICCHLSRQPGHLLLTEMHHYSYFPDEETLRKIEQ